MKNKSITLILALAITLSACSSPNSEPVTETEAATKEARTEVLATMSVPGTEEGTEEKTQEKTTSVSITETEQVTASASQAPEETEGTAISKTVVITDGYVEFPVDTALIPEYSGEPYVDLALETDLTTLWDEVEAGYLIISDYDGLGRCGSCVIHAVKDILPTGERGSIGDTKPTGWVQNKYPGIVETEPAYVMQRSHIIAYCICDEPSNPRLLISGASYFNNAAMKPTEVEVVRLIEDGNEVLYRVSPLFEGENLFATGVLMEAVSKDGTFSVCRFAYNVQPGITFDYATGENWIEGAERESESQEEKDYILNTSSHKFHTPSCESVNDIKDKNKSEFHGTRAELIDMGYDPCKRCNP